MIILSDPETSVFKKEKKYVEKLNLQQKQLMFQRIFNRHPTYVNYVNPTSPVTLLLLNHFYDIEIKGPYKFDEIKLTDSIISNFFNNITVNHLP